MKKVLHLIVVKYIGATDTKESRIKLISNKEFGTVTLAFKSNYYSIATDQAIDYLKEKNFNIIGVSENTVITDTFKSLK